MQDRPIKQDLSGEDEAYLDGIRGLESRRFTAARRRFVRVIRDGGRRAPFCVGPLVETVLRGDDGSDPAEVLQETLADSQAMILHGLGYLARRTGDWPAALQRSEEALAAAPEEPVLMLERGLVLSLVGRRDEGLPLLLGAEAAFRSAKDAVGMAAALRYLAIQAFEDMRLLECLERLKEAERYEVGSLTALATIFEFRGRAQANLTDYRAALPALREALSLREQQGDTLSAAFVMTAIAGCHTALDHPEGARPYLRRALEIFRGEGNSWAAAAVRANLGFCSRLSGDTPSMVRYYKSALEGLESRGNPNAFVNASTNLAEAYSLIGKPESALDVLARVDPKELSQADLRTRLEFHTDRARALLALGRVEDALESVNTGLAEAPAEGTLLLKDRIEAEVILGRALVGLGRSKDGRRVLERITRRLETLLRDQPGVWIRMGLMERHRSAHDALVESHLQDRSRGPYLAWRVSQRAKARTLLEAGRGRDGAEARQAPGPLDEVEAEIRRLASSSQPSPKSSTKLKELRRRYADLMGERTDAGSRRVRPLSIQDTSRLLGSGTALADYHLTLSAGHVFVVHDGSLEVVPLAGGTRAFQREVEAILEPLKQAGESLDPSLWLRAWDPDAAATLGERLLAPVLEALPDTVRELIVVPDGPLHLTPFEILQPLEPEAGAIRLRYLPSVNLLRPADLARSSPSSELLATGFSPAEGTVIQGLEGLESLPPLPGAHEEAEGLGPVFQQARILTGDSATPAAWRAAAGDFTYLHVAAHALADPFSPGLSSLVLAPERSSDQVGYLTAHGIQDLELRARLVTLSACETAQGRLRQREGLLSLARAFLQAGAEAVLASLWPVDDKATRILMKSFYRALQQGLEPSECLQRARRDLRQEEGGIWDHPFFWGSFLLFDRKPPEDRGALF